MACDGGTHTTLAVRRCPWCGNPTTWRDFGAVRAWGTCRHCADIERLAREEYGPSMRDELRQAVRRR